MKGQDSSKYVLIFWAVNIAFVLFKILFALRPELDLFTEETQYWLWSKNLDWQYYSKPPMVAVLNFLSTSIFGDTELAIRIIPATFGFLSAALIFLFTEKLYRSDRMACWAGIIFLAMPVNFLVFTFHTTDTSMTFFWLLAWFAFYRAVHSEGRKYWVLTGIAAALGILSKSTMLLIFPAGIIYLLFTKQLKEHFWNFTLMGLIALLGFIPGIIWNFQHDFYTFKHIATLGGASGEKESFDFGLMLARSSEYLGGQLAMVSVFFLPIFYFAIKSLIKTKNERAFFMVLPGLLTFLGFGGLSLSTWILVNWPGFTYSSFAVFLAPVVVVLTDRWRKYSIGATFLSISLIWILLIPNYGEWKSSGFLNKGEKALFKRVIGYEELGARVQSLADSLGGGQPVIFSESYHTASELAFYMSSHPQTLVINMGSRKNQWDLWPGMDRQVGNQGRFVFVSRTKDSPGDVAKFAKLVHEEELVYYFRKDSIGKSKIQIWEHLLEYTPVETNSY
ncbi:ArnT family glycosyltransferase [Algoriphagus litoralis]|uniref:ArnT family glycosyltransferase n=1 Tax=Algoriphagus litoralis TaxID=2202829 RepID=UPI000DB94717|nr:glycosyltransferase family 39 protein [Algoriphagus litoralis]